MQGQREWRGRVLSELVVAAASIRRHQVVLSCGRCDAESGLEQVAGTPNPAEAVKGWSKELVVARQRDAIQR